MRKLIIFIGLLTLLFSCHTAKMNRGVSSTVQKLTPVMVLDAVLSKENSFYSMNISKLTIDITNHNNDQYSVKAFVRLVEDSVIQLSLQPLLGIEMGRMQITPTEIIVIDRLHSRYCKTDAGQLKEVTGFNFDFYLLQSLLSNKLLHQEETTETQSSVDGFAASEFKEFPDMYEIRPTGEFGTFQSAFVVNSQFQIEWAIISEVNHPRSLSCQYSNFMKVGNVDFPHKMEFNAYGEELMYKVNLTVTSIAFDEPMNLTFSVPQKYQEIDVSDFSF